MADKTPKWLVVGDGFVDITLSRQLDIGGAKVAQVRMREPMVRDQQAMSKMSGDNVDKEINFFANLCDLVPDDIVNLPMRDYARLQSAYNTFID